jgi:hypothetical protein
MSRSASGSNSWQEGVAVVFSHIMQIKVYFKITQRSFSKGWMYQWVEIGHGMGANVPELNRKFMSA